MTTEEQWERIAKHFRNAHKAKEIALKAWPDFGDYLKSREISTDDPGYRPQPGKWHSRNWLRELYPARPHFREDRCRYKSNDITSKLDS